MRMRQLMHKAVYRVVMWWRHHTLSTEETQLQEGLKGVTIATLSGVPRYYTFRIRGILQGWRVTTLIDGGATHKFIDATLITRRHILRKDFEGFSVVVADGYNMTFTKRIRGLDVTLGNYNLTCYPPLLGITRRSCLEAHRS
jgi:hypothetical protein